jgi:ABC-type transporter Mla maintaining outer membrane lipid asymmetry permease subunit MlaE
VGSLNVMRWAASPTVRLRTAALHELWRCRGSWQLPLPRALMRRERDQVLAAMMPAVIVVAAVVGLVLFVTLPSTLADAYRSALAALWPAWVTQAAPLVAALLLALQRMPTLALELQRRQQQGEFEALARMASCPSVYPCVPMLVAHAIAAAAASMLLTAISLLAGFAMALAVDVGDLRTTLEAVFTLVTPVDLLRCLCSGALLGLLCSLGTILYAWPGTQRATEGVDAHRLGVHATVISALVVIMAAIAFGTILAWLGAGRV